MKLQTERPCYQFDSLALEKEGRREGHGGMPLPCDATGVCRCRAMPRHPTPPVPPSKLAPCTSLPTCKIGRQRGVHQHEAIQVPHVLCHRQRGQRIKHAQRVALIQQLLQKTAALSLSASSGRVRGSQDGPAIATAWAAFVLPCCERFEGCFGGAVQRGLASPPLPHFPHVNTSAAALAVPPHLHVALVQRACDEKHHIIDHVAVGAEVEESTKGLAHACAQVLPVIHELSCTAVHDGGGVEHCRLVGQVGAIVGAGLEGCQLRCGWGGGGGGGGLRVCVYA
jgi:hypothetical protein